MLHLAVVWQDWEFFSFAVFLYSSAVYVGFVFEALFLMLILLLTVSCYRVANEIGRIWRDVGEEVIKASLDKASKAEA
jgi:hypothetical protein